MSESTLVRISAGVPGICLIVVRIPIIVLYARLTSLLTEGLVPIDNSSGFTAFSNPASKGANAAPPGIRIPVATLPANSTTPMSDFQSKPVETGTTGVVLTLSPPVPVEPTASVELCSLPFALPSGLRSQHGRPSELSQLHSGSP